MKRLIALLCALSLGACSSAQLATFQTNLANFETGVADVNQAVGAVSQTLLKNCTAIQATAQALLSLTQASAPNSKSAIGGISAANAVITTYCQIAPNDVPSAIAATAAAVQSAKAAYTAAKAGN